MGTRLRGKISLLFMTCAVLFTVPAIALADDIYNTLDGSVDATVEITDINVGDDKSVAYKVDQTNGDGKPGCNLTGDSSLGVSVTSSKPSVATVSPSSLTFTGCSSAPTVTVTGVSAGTARITLSQTSNTTNGSFNLAPATFDVTVSDPAPPADTTAPTIDYTLNPATPDGSNDWYKSNVTLTWNVTDPESSVTKTGCVNQSITTDQAATTYSCSASSAGGSAGPVSVSIQRDATAPTNVQFNGGPAEGGSYAYGSVPVAPTSCTANGAVSGLASCDVTGYSNAVGDHTLTATATDNAGNVATLTRSYTIVKANQAPLTVTSPSNGTYGDHLTINTSGGTTGGAVSFEASGTACRIDANNKLEVTDGTGTCSVTATMAGNANYNDVTSDAHSVAVSKRAVTVTADAQSKYYGQNDPALTSQITSGSLVNGDQFTGALSRAAGNDAGTYAIEQGTLALPASKYVLSYVGADLTIAPRPVTVTPDSGQGKTYGDSDPAALSYTLSSPVGPPALVGNDQLIGALSRAAGNNAGTYLIGLGSLSGDSNYDLSLSSTPVYFTIAKRPISVMADAQSKLFGDPDPALTYQVSGGPLVNGDSFIGSLSRDPGEAVGQYNILLGSVKVSDGNYGNNYAITYNGAKLTIGAWTLKGFYSPVDMDTATTAALNTVKGGSTVPLKFEVFKGTTELTNTSVIKSFGTKAVACPGADAAVDEIEFLTTGGTSLRYDATAPGQFIQNWQTPKKVGCFDVTMETQDGSKLVAHFKLR